MRRLHKLVYESQAIDLEAHVSNQLRGCAQQASRKPGRILIGVKKRVLLRLVPGLTAGVGAVLLVASFFCGWWSGGWCSGVGSLGGSPAHCVDSAVINIPARNDLLFHIALVLSAVLGATAAFLIVRGDSRPQVLLALVAGTILAALSFPLSGGPSLNGAAVAMGQPIAVIGGSLLALSAAVVAAGKLATRRLLESR
jgi:hypothetical protein